MTELMKFDRGKPRLDLLPTSALEEVAKVMAAGAAKYDDHNWRKGTAWSRYYAAALRHLFAWWRGEDNDPETGLSHLAHATCCLLFILEYARGGKRHEKNDDRYKDEVQHASN